MSKIKKKELGMGIRALLSNMDEQNPDNRDQLVRELSHSIAMIPLEQIEVNPFQPRIEFDEESLQELAESLKVHGLIQPLTLRRLAPDQYQLISGERRLRAARMAGLTEVPAYIRLANDQEMLEMALVENIQRQDLNAIEVAITFQRLLDECSLTHEALSERVGKKRSSVTNYLRLLKLPPVIQQALKKNTLSMGHARALAGIENLPLQLKLYQKTVAEGISVRALESLIQQYQKSRASKEAKPSFDFGSDYHKVEDRFKQFFGVKNLQLKVNAKGKGQIVIPFNTTGELNRMIDALDKD